MRGRVSLVVLLALALAGCSGTDQSTTPAAKPGDFVLHAHAVQVGNAEGKPSAYDGISILVPLGQCAIGIGVYDTGNGTAGAHWTGGTDCTSFKVPAPSGGLTATAAVAMADGSVVGGTNALRRLSPEGTVTTLADLTPRPDRINAIVRSGDRLVIGGGQLGEDKSTPLMWTSDDGGKSVTPVQLPQVNGIVGPMAANGDTVVAIEQLAKDGPLGSWRSADGGRTWQLAEINTGPAGPIITNLLRTAHGWLIVGTGEDEHNPAGRPFLASSSDGAAWQVVDTSKLDAGQVVDATVTKSDDVVIIGSAPTSDSKSGCSAAWVGPVGSMHRVDLGCDDVAKATTTLADGRVIIVGASSVWVRA
ncbi:hypothetical protein [Kutzneria sp. NPDC051319]|uniref:hypothetical protein n=1 Tax=Kutzneria sp. NPDC051319 TaxID=3155047 RepID=UPI0034417CE2